MGRFSIFREFFREYDTESKLILMEAIPEVGEEKEWEFLRGLLEDPEPAIRAKASQMLKVLGCKLGIDTLPDQEAPQTPTPPDASGDLHEVELNFTPEISMATRRKAGITEGESSQSTNKWLRWAIKRKNQSHG